MHLVFPGLVLRPQECEDLATMLMDCRRVKEAFGPSAAGCIDKCPYGSYLRMPLCAKPDPKGGGTVPGVYWVDTVWQGPGLSLPTAGFAATQLFEMAALLPLVGQMPVEIQCVADYAAHRAKRRKLATPSPSPRRFASGGPAVAVELSAGSFPEKSFCTAVVLALIQRSGEPCDAGPGDFTTVPGRDGDVYIRCRKPVPCPIARRTHGKASTAVFRVKPCGLEVGGTEVAQRCYHDACSGKSRAAVEQRAPWHRIETFYAGRPSKRRAPAQKATRSTRTKDDGGRVNGAHRRKALREAPGASSARVCVKRG